MENIIIGKRITFGGVVGAAVSTACWFWSLHHPAIPAEIALAISTAITGVGQVFIVNKFGVTTE